MTSILVTDRPAMAKVLGTRQVQLHVLQSEGLHGQN